MKGDKSRANKRLGQFIWIALALILFSYLPTFVFFDLRGAEITSDMNEVGYWLVVVTNWIWQIALIIVACTISLQTFFHDKEHRNSTLSVIIVIVAAYLLHFYGTRIVQFQSPDAQFRDAPMLLYSLDQFLKGAAFDLLEGLRIDVTDIIGLFIDYETSLPRPASNSPQAIFDALFRTFISAGVMVSIYGFIRRFRSNSN